MTLIPIQSAVAALFEGNFQTKVAFSGVDGSSQALVPEK
jgi:hypothetical protein